MSLGEKQKIKKLIDELNLNMYESNEYIRDILYSKKTIPLLLKKHHDMLEKENGIKYLSNICQQKKNMTQM